jgi:cbb3-type cytochrome oxidase subunit 3
MPNIRRNRLRTTRYDWAAVFVVLTLLAIWWFTGCRYAWMRHLVLASALFYFFVVRIAVNLYRMKKDNSENASEENKNQIRIDAGKNSHSGFRIAVHAVDRTPRA